MLALTSATCVWHARHYGDLRQTTFSSMDASATVRLPRSVVPSAEEQGAVAEHLQVQTPAESSDELLLDQASHGCTEAIAFLFKRYARVVRAVAYRVLRDKSEADDLLQDVFILIQRKCSMFDPTRGPARFWILRMAYHSALARRRYLNSRHFYSLVGLEDVENHLTDSGNGNCGQYYGEAALIGDSRLSTVFHGLSDDQQETLRLFFVEGYTLPEIAAKLNQAHGNVKHHYFRGLEKLRKHVFNGKLRGNSAV